MVKTKKFLYVKPFFGEPTAENFQLIEEEIGEPKDGEILAEAIYWSVDPYMRPYMARYPVGSVMIGGQVARIVKSKNANFPVNAIIYGHFGWRTHTIGNPNEESLLGKPYLLPPLEGHSPSLGLGVVGMPGNTAYFGFLEICRPKVGETVVVTGAAGAVGSLVGQIAKIKGCTVIGFAGSDEKVNWLTKDLGFDYAFNYKTIDIATALKKAAPKGVDCYFDNVGGEISSTIIGHMNDFGRVANCGSITAYNAKEFPKASILQPFIVGKQLKFEGFLAQRWTDRWQEGLMQMFQWVQEGKLKYRETVTDGFEQMPKAFGEMLNGKNIGKAIVKAV